MESLKRLSRHLADRPARLRELKGKGARIVGYFPGDYVPEEIIYASGAIPLCLCNGGDPIVVQEAQSKTMRFLCAFAKAQLGELLLKEDPYYSIVDTLVAPITCAHLRKIADMWQYYGDMDVFRFGIPREYDTEIGEDYYNLSTARLKEKMELITGNRVDDKELKKSIDLYNRLRGLLRKISLMRKYPQTPITTLDFLKLNHASFYGDPDEIVEILTELYKELQEKQKEGNNHGRPRLLLTGPNLARGDYKVVEIIEEAGGTVVVEEACEGVRYYWEDVEDDKDYGAALGKRYLMKRTPCAFMNASASKRFDFIMKLVNEFSVDGIIWYHLLYCETYDIESFFMTRKMEEAGIPMLKIQTDYEAAEIGPLRTRVETFIEMLKRKGGGS
ncbi:MAG: 2-hydroxyacyl-CoA dehydratase family protein [Thermodesulfobacteriota bacterium]|nr:2-hydroxyacyl-CoA dehydratase family protein [Thermodesulfobacteriota bacterium]